LDQNDSPPLWYCKIDGFKRYSSIAAGSDNAGIFSVRGVLKKGSVAFKTAAPVNYVDWLKSLTEKTASITFEGAEHNAWLTWLANRLPLILILGLCIFIMRSMQKNAQRWRQPPIMPDYS
jgi:ATP-dependent Zn protease